MMRRLMWLCLIVFSSLAIAQEVADLSSRVLAELDKVFEQAVKDTQYPWALRDIAQAMAKAGLLERAYEVAKGIEEPIPRLQALAAIVAERRKAGMVKEQGWQRRPLWVTVV